MDEIESSDCTGLLASPPAKRAKTEAVANDTDTPLKERARLSELHRKGGAPWSFLMDAIHSPEEFLRSSSEITYPTFGLSDEAYRRDCHVNLMKQVLSTIQNWQQDEERRYSMHLLEIRGSAGIGKSAFLAFVIATILRKELLPETEKNFALFYSTKGGSVDDIRCSVWIDGALVEDQICYSDTHFKRELQKNYMKKLRVIFMDGCCLPINWDVYDGLGIAALSPSVSTHGLRDLLSNHDNYTVLHMPCWTIEEVKIAGDLLGVDSAVIDDNFQYMNGIVRYMFQDGVAKKHVDKSVGRVDPVILSRMLSSQHTDKDTELSMVHSLVRWLVPATTTMQVRFELVSRYAEQVVAQKLSAYDTAKLAETRRSLRAVSGAESYAGALFEAYAIRTLMAGGSFAMRPLTSDAGADTETVVLPSLQDENLVVMECNTLSNDTAPIDSVRVKDGDQWTPKLLWPTTSNFPTFDAYYFAGNGDIYSLQMTIAKNHGLKNNGAYQTKEYLDSIEASGKPYKAIFVVPKGSLSKVTRPQAFEGSVTKGKKKIMEAEEATALMNETFRQYVIEMD